MVVATKDQRSNLTINDEETNPAGSYETHAGWHKIQIRDWYFNAFWLDPPCSVCLHPFLQGHLHTHRSQLISQVAEDVRHDKWLGRQVLVMS